MQTIERIKMIKAMEFICRNINDEEVFYTWLTDGVADGDIEHGDLSITDDDIENLEYWYEEPAFADLMDTFLHCMAKARKSGGLYCDGVVSKAG
ncbi:MAG: hypothetical protein IJV40_11045 [Oscillospiraceae bacterium]|nr:hypothetical protein [Oscillospiraceae bacterium]